MSQLEAAKDEKKAKARAATKAKALEDGWRGFANVELTVGQKLQAKTYMQDVARVWDNLFALIEENYKLTISYDEQRSAYNLSLTCKGKGNINQGLTLTGRGGSVEAAAVSLWFKHEIILEGDWNRAAQATGGGYGADEFD